MRKYFLFSIQKEYYDVYHKNPMVLYKTLENLYHLKKDNINFGLSLYKQICNIIDVNRLKYYFEQVCIKKRDRKYLVVSNKEAVVFNIYYSCIVCKTVKNYPKGLKILNYYDKYLFVCDFENKDYFFLNDSSINNRKHKYNYS